jgi:Cu/Ag efflux protein CusF
MDRNKILIALAAVALAFSFTSVSFAADKKTTDKKATEKTTSSQKTAAIAAAKAKANFGMLAGTVTSINNSDPANVKLSVKNDADGSMHTVMVTPVTNITKVTDISELKTGEQVRMMTRKVDDKDVAMGIMFGKVKTAPAAVSRTKSAAKK